MLCKINNGQDDFDNSCVVKIVESIEILIKE